jgi:flagellar M-ring protein FliF
VNLAPLLERWNALEPRLRIGIGSAAFAAIVIVAVVMLLGRDTRVVLFANPLQPDQLAEVDAQLSAWSVAFIPSHDNVRVNAKQRSTLLARLALVGVPHAHVAGTSETLSAVGTLTPQAILDAQTRAGLEGDLEKGLRGLGGIAEARVIIAPARTGVFADESPTPASASVRLTAEPGATLTQSTLAAVRAFVASGIAGLDITHVTIVDDRGAYDGREQDDGSDRELALQSALDAAFGPGATIVRVHVERNTTATESRDIKRSPDRQAAILRHDLDERFTGEKKSYSRRATSEDRGSDMHEERTTLAAGVLARVSIAVIVDARRSLDVDKIREVAAAAGGYDPRRGDTLSVEAVAFDRPNGVAPQPFAYALGVLGEAIPGVALAVMVIVIVRVAARPVFAFLSENARRMRLEHEMHPGASSPQEMFERFRGEPPHVVAAIVARLPSPLATAVLELYPADERRAIVARLARKPTRLVAETLVR